MTTSPDHTPGPLNRALRLAWRILAIAAIGLMLYAQVQRTRPVELPAPRGPYAVGRMLFEWVDTTRAEPYAPELGAHRKLTVWVWYPAAPQPGAVPAAYLPGRWAQVTQQSNFQFIFAQSLDSVRVHAVESAPVAGDGAPYPVLVLMPGMNLAATDYTTLAEGLAGRGYVVAAVNPTYSAPVVVFADGGIVQSSRDAIFDPSEALATEWARDATFVADRLAELSAGTGPLAGALDVERLGLLGHSFGGTAATQACRLDARCLAAVALDAEPHPEVISSGFDRPLMLLMGEAAGAFAATCDDECRRFDQEMLARLRQLPGEHYRVLVRGARHYNFLDAAIFFSPIYRFYGALGPMDGRRGLAVIQEYTMAFFDRYLKQQPASLLTGDTTGYPEVDFAGR